MAPMRHVVESRILKVKEAISARITLHPVDGGNASIRSLPTTNKTQEEGEKTENRTSRSTWRCADHDTH